MARAVIYTLCLKKVPTFKLSVTLSSLNQFSKILHCWKAYEICYKPLPQYPPHLRHVAAPPWEIKTGNTNFLQIFSRYGKKSKHIAFLSPLTLLFIHKFRYFRCLKQRVFHHVIANKIFHVTVLLLVYFCNQFVAPQIRHSRRHSSVCQQSTWYSVMRTIFW